jgi:hypothetical protein
MRMNEIFAYFDIFYGVSSDSLRGTGDPDGLSPSFFREKPRELLKNCVTTVIIAWTGLSPLEVLAVPSWIYS